MKRTLTLVFALMVWGGLWAQHEPIQPYEELGIKVKVLTLSNGKYQESFPNDTLQRIGSVIFNRVTGEVVSVVERDTLYGEYDLRPEVASRWISPDPLAEKFPGWSPYTYGNDSPVFFIDPDGRENIPAVLWAIKNMANKNIPFDIWYGGKSGWTFQRDVVPTETVCYESCWTSYMNGANKTTEAMYKNSGFATRSGGFKGRNAGIEWFKSGGKDRSFITDITKDEIGDIVFMGGSGSMEGHATLLLDIPEITKDKQGNLLSVRLITLSTGSDSDSKGGYGVRDFTFTLQNGNWMPDDNSPGHIFRGFGQMHNIQPTGDQLMDLNIQKIFLDYGSVKSLSTHNGVIQQN